MKIQLDRIDNDTAGKSIETCRFPFTLGQGTNCDLQIDAKGVWTKHLVLNERSKLEITALPCPDSLVVINGVSRSKETRLDHGDLIELGAAKFHFWFAPLGQADRHVFESLIWTALLLLFIAQASIIWLLI